MSFSQRRRNGDPNLDTELLKIYFIVSDADMLESMGLVGFLRTFMYQAVHSSKTSTAYEFVQNQLLHCNKYLYSPWAKKEGSIRHKRMIDLICVYCDERTIH